MCPLLAAIPVSILVYVCTGVFHACVVYVFSGVFHVCVMCEKPHRFP